MQCMDINKVPEGPGVLSSLFNGFPIECLKGQARSFFGDLVLHRNQSMGRGNCSMDELMNPDVFFRLHADLPREGPGEPEDVAWAARLAGLNPEALVLDAASGPGGDIGSLLCAAPKGHVTAVDLHGPFIDTAHARWGKDSRVTLITDHMLAPEGPFDFIWCAGAVYFLGIGTALSGWRPRLAPCGSIAFSEPCYFTEDPSEGAGAMWEGEGVTVVTEAGITDRIKAVGYEVLGQRRLSDTAWENYYRPLESRIGQLRAGADNRLAKVLDENEAEIAAWRTHREETGYLLSVVRPG